MTFQDIFKSDFLDNMTSVSLLDSAIALGLAFSIGLFIFWIYKLTYRGVMYSSGFGLSLIALCMITTLIILAISSNIILSLGMVGALSIVRFRAAIKDPLDIVYLFWSIAAGIVLAAGLLPLAVFGSVFIGLLIVIFSGKKSYDNPYILVINFSDRKNEDAIYELLKKNVKKIELKSKKVAKNDIEINYEIRLKSDDSSFMDVIANMDTVTNAVLVSYNGEYAG